MFLFHRWLSHFLVTSLTNLHLFLITFFRQTFHYMKVPEFLVGLQIGTSQVAYLKVIVFPFLLGLSNSIFWSMAILICVKSLLKWCIQLPIVMQLCWFILCKCCWSCHLKWIVQLLIFSKIFHGWVGISTAKSQNPTQWPFVWTFCQSHIF